MVYARELWFVAKDCAEPRKEILQWIAEGREPKNEKTTDAVASCNISEVLKFPSDISLEALVALQSSALMRRTTAGRYCHVVWRRYSWENVHSPRYGLSRGAWA